MAEVRLAEQQVAGDDGERRDRRDPGPQPDRHEHRGGGAHPQQGEPQPVRQVRQPRDERLPEVVVVGDSVDGVAEEGAQVEQRDRADRDAQNGDGAHAARPVEHGIPRRASFERRGAGTSSDSLTTLLVAAVMALLVMARALDAAQHRDRRAAGVLEGGDGGFEVARLVIVRRVRGHPVERVVEEVDRGPDAHVGVPQSAAVPAGQPCRRARSTRSRPTHR